MLPGVNFKVHCQHFRHNVNPFSEKHMFKGCLHFHLSASLCQTEKDLGWSGNIELRVQIHHRAKQETKHADSREMM